MQELKVEPSTILDFFEEHGLPRELALALVERLAPSGTVVLRLDDPGVTFDARSLDHAEVDAPPLR